ASNKSAPAITEYGSSSHSTCLIPSPNGIFQGRSPGADEPMKVRVADGWDRRTRRKAFTITSGFFSDVRRPTVTIDGHAPVTTGAASAAFTRVKSIPMPPTGANDTEPALVSLR